MGRGLGAGTQDPTRLVTRHADVRYAPGMAVTFRIRTYAEDGSMISDFDYVDETGEGADFFGAQALHADGVAGVSVYDVAKPGVPNSLYGKFPKASI